MTRLTVCELPDFDSPAFEGQFDALVEHAIATDSDVVVLPEMPFSSWLPAHDPPDEDIKAAWTAAVDSHAEWVERLDAFGDMAVLGSRPVVRDDTRFNEGFVRTVAGVQGGHLKSYLPDEPGFWEASWYEAGEGDFDLRDCAGLAVGMLVCTDLWASHEVRAYGEAGAELLVNPRVTEQQTLEKWLAGARTMGVLAGAYLASSNRSGVAKGTTFGGAGWVTSPDGTVLARTDDDHPFVTTEIDTDLAEVAKGTYPRDALRRAESGW